MIEDFATRPLPSSFSYASINEGNEGYEIYPQKLFPDTWQLLQSCKLVGSPTWRSGRPTAAPTGLSLLSIVADCCAGDTLARITDQGAAYATLAGMFVGEPGPQTGPDEQTREQLVAIPLRVVDADSFSLASLIDLRKREAATPEGHHIRDLRHRFVNRVEEQARQLSSASSALARDELRRQFEQEAKDDFRSLREALKAQVTQVIGTKEVLTSLIGGLGVVANAGHNYPMADVVSGVGAIVSIGGLLATWSKIVQERRKVLQEHPIAYLYEVRGGLRL